MTAELRWPGKQHGAPGNSECLPSKQTFCEQRFSWRRLGEAEGHLEAVGADVHLENGSHGQTSADESPPTPRGRTRNWTQLEAMKCDVGNQL